MVLDRSSATPISRIHDRRVDRVAANRGDAVVRAGPRRIGPDRSADVAQLVERWLPKPKVAGSRPVVRLGFLPAIEVVLLCNDVLQSSRATFAGNCPPDFSPLIVGFQAEGRDHVSASD